MPDTPQRLHTKVELDDGTMLEATVDQRDYRRYDLARSKHSWPPATEVPFLLQGFVCASALIRQGDVTETDPAVLMERIVQVTDLGTDPILPTAGALGPA